MVYILDNRIVYDSAELTADELKTSVQLEILEQPNPPNGTYPLLRSDFETQTAWWDYVNAEPEIHTNTIEETVEELKQLVADLASLQLEVLMNG